MKQKIVIVDDDKLVLDLYSDFFKQHDFKVHVATSVDAALKIIRQETPDIILSDIVMPVKNGFVLYEEVKLFDPDIPFIFMTGFEHDKKIARKLKKVDYKWISKPVKLEELLNLVLSQLKN
ncbi:MAG: response regulator [Candidatus Marinimicrobia bacterium]|nr:response regulator [Candidatus Neomarinimicrobiota bacterium]